MPGATATRCALADYAALTEHGDRARVFAALDELVAARVLIADAERYRFSQRGFLPVLQEASPNGGACCTIGWRDCWAAVGSPVRHAHHLLHANREREGVELLCRLDLHNRAPEVALAELALEARRTL